MPAGSSRKALIGFTTIAIATPAAAAASAAPVPRSCSCTSSHNANSEQQVINGSGWNARLATTA